MSVVKLSEFIKNLKLTAKQEKIRFTVDEKKYLKPAQWVDISKLKSLKYIGSEPVFADIMKNYKKESNI